jgi:FKBP12-rapamycin complex-associated protein
VPALVAQHFIADMHHRPTLVRYGGESQVQTAIFEGLASTSIDSWLEVMPQFLSRLETPNLLVRESVYKILSDLGREHPQALVMPLVVLAQSQRQPLGVAAQMLAQMRRHSAPLIDQACLVASELVRVALLWHERWHTTLSTASTAFFDNLNVDGMTALVQPLHDAMRHPETLNEIAFTHAFGTELLMAESLVKEFHETKDLRCMSRAWSYYHDVSCSTMIRLVCQRPMHANHMLFQHSHRLVSVFQVFRRAGRMLPRLTVLELKDVSPRLLRAANLVLSVPGTYAAGTPLVTVSSFDSTLQVIASKQRPRKLWLRGSDGQRYVDHPSQ